MDPHPHPPQQQQQPLTPQTPQTPTEIQFQVQPQSQAQLQQVQDPSRTVSASVTKRTGRKNRVNFTPEQLAILESAFEETPYPDAIRRESIAAKADLPEGRVQACIFTLLILFHSISLPKDFYHGPKPQKLATHC